MNASIATSAVDDGRRRESRSASRARRPSRRWPIAADGGRDAAGDESRERREGDVVLDDLRARLARDPLQLLRDLLLGLLALANRLEVEVVEGDPPLEERHQQHVVEGLEQVDRVPLLVRVDPHDLVAEVLVLAADIGVGVVDVVVGVLPRLLGRGRVPVPGRGVDLGVVHPVPLAVHDVVADLHVLEDLRRRERGGPEQPGGPVARGEELDPSQDHEPAVELDHRLDVGRVALAEVVEDLVVDRVELAPERLDLLLGEARQRALDVLVDRLVVLALRLLGGAHGSRLSSSVSSVFSSFVFTARSRPRPRGR